MTYFVTGENGFVGKYLMRCLQAKGAKVVGLSSSGKDISKTDYFDGIIAEKGDVVIHLANKSTVPGSWDNTHRYFEVNVLGTVNVLEFCKRFQTGIVYLSSYLYGDPDYFPIDELHPVKVNNPYALSKKYCEETIQFYNKSFGVNYTIFRPFNIYGTDQSKDFIIPIMIEQILSAEYDHVTVKDSRPKRDFVHVQDVVDAIVEASRNLKNEIYNLCTGHSVSLKELYRVMLEISLSEKPLVDQENHRKNEIMDCFGSFDKVQRDLNWRPKITLVEGLSRYIHNYKKNGDQK